MSNQNVEPDIHTVRVNMSNGPQRQTKQRSGQHASGSLSPDGYNREYQQSSPDSTKRQTRSDAVYVNSAYVGSVNSVNNINRPRYEAPTSVIREQYCVCSRWPFAQRALAITVGLLLGTVVSLIITLSLKKNDTDIRSILRLAPEEQPEASRVRRLK